MRIRLLLCLALVGCDDGEGETAETSPDAGATTDAATAPPDASSPEPDALAPDAATPGIEDNFGVEETEGRAECDNLLETHCLMPFPSDRFLKRDGGRSVVFDDAAMPTDNRGRQIRGDTVANADGWGIATPPILYWPGATLEGTAPVFQPQASLEPEAKTIILDTVTGERVPHWVETDYLTAEADWPNLVLRTAVPFVHDRRYVVAVRGLVDEGGAVLEAPPGFAALRDETASTRLGVHARRARFDAEVFAPLVAHGVERAQLQLAWDFTTGTYENATGLLVEMRDALLEAVGPEGPEYTVDDVETLDGHPHIAVRARLTVHIPSFLLEPTALSLRRIRRDDAGHPVIEGFEDWPMTVQIPHSVLDSEEPGGVLQYGHGFLGSLGQGDGSWLRLMAFNHRFLIIATDMQGMSDVDTAYWGANLIADPAIFPAVTEKALQGILNQVVMQRMMKGRFLAEANPLLTRDGAPLYDPDDVWYYGNSQGGTIGSVVMAVTPEVTRGVLGVPGCCYPILVHRSTVFINFVALLEQAMPDPTDLGIMLGLIGGTGMRYIDPINYAPAIVHEPFPNTPAHEVLLHVAKEDAQVHNEVSYILGRGIDVPLVTPALRPVWGFEEVPAPHAGSGMVEFDFSVPDNPDPLLPPLDEHDTHGSLRKQPEGQDQMMQFLKTGVIEDTCAGPCIFPERP